MSLPDSVPVVRSRRYSTDHPDDVVEKIPPWKKALKQVLAALVVNMLAFVFGTVLGWPAPSQPLLMSDTPPIGGKAVTSEAMSWLAAVMSIGNVCGTFAFGWLADKVGRKIAGLVGAVPFLVSWLCILLADEIAWLYVGRVLGGLAGGASLVVCPTYIGETVEDSLRGLLGSLFSVFLVGGILFAYVVGSYVSFHAYAIICLIIPCVFFACFIFMPDTPAFLISKGKMTPAVRSLTWLRGGRADLVDDELARLVASIKEAGVGENESFMRVARDLLVSRPGRKAAIIMMVLFTVQQFCGINAILSYTVEIFRESGSTLDPSAATIIVGALQLTGVIVSTFLIDRAGRRILLMASYSGMAVSLFILGGCFYMKAHKQDISSVDWLPVVCLAMYSVTYALGSGPVPFVLVSELFSSSVRSLATSFSIAYTCLLAFLIMKFYANMCDGMGVHGSMWFFAVVSTMGVAFVWWFVIETKGKSLNVILLELDGRPPMPVPNRSSTGGRLFNPLPGEIFYTPANDQEETVA